MAKDKDIAPKSKSSGFMTKAVIGIVVIAIGACAARAYVPVPAEQVEQEQAEQMQAEEQEQAERLQEMSTDAREVEQVLTNGTWQTDDAIYQVAFKRGSYTITHNVDQGDPIAYTIGTVSKHKDSNSYRGETDVEYTFVLKDVKGEHIAKLTQVQSNTGVDANWKLVCDGLAQGGTLTNQPVTGTVHVEGMPSEAASALGGDEGREKLIDEVTDFCTRTFPTAKACVFDNAITIDYAKNRAEIRFTVDNRTQTKLLVYYNFADKTVNIQEG